MENDFYFIKNKVTYNESLQNNDRKNHYATMQVTAPIQPVIAHTIQKILIFKVVNKSYDLKSRTNCNTSSNEKGENQNAHVFNDLIIYLLRN